MLQVAGRRCVVVGGGAVAARRAASLVAGGAQVVVVAPEMHDKLDDLLIERRERGYQTDDLDGAFLVVIATDRAEVNHRVAEDAEASGVLINRADDAGSGDFTVMAHDRRGPLTVAVDTAHTSAAAAKRIRGDLLAVLDDDWITLLAEARPWRGKIQCSIDDATTRAARLRRLADDTAMQTLKEQGVSGLRVHLQAVAEGRADD